jgi:hypothetical protein
MYFEALHSKYSLAAKLNQISAVVVSGDSEFSKVHCPVSKHHGRAIALLYTHPITPTHVNDYRGLETVHYKLYNVCLPTQPQRNKAIVDSQIEMQLTNSVAFLQSTTARGLHALSSLAHVQRGVADGRALLLRPALELGSRLRSVQTRHVLHAPVPFWPWTWRARGRGSRRRGRRGTTARAIRNYIDLVLTRVTRISNSCVREVRGGAATLTRNFDEPVPLGAAAISVDGEVESDTADHVAV